MGDLSVGSILCGDCNATDPEWASLNRGLLLCKECCFIHRSLGPQYSKIKFLKDSKWNPHLKKMVMTLAAGPANHVWEHLLLDPSKSDKDSSIKKPGPHDSIDVKKKFIQLKHFQYQFVLRTNGDSFDVRSQELHSTVRTSAVDTTLRLLASGADPNFFHPEKGTRPIHVAARNGQALQIELLFLHGAHTDAPDYLGQTPVEHAIAAGHKELAQRIIELRYDLTDQLSFYVCGEFPDHISSKHILLPSIKSKNNIQETSITNLPPNVLEQLAADLYDEVDRRLIESVIAKYEAEKSKFSIAFLPVNPHYPSVRNQTRQKFARLADEELSSLISLVLSESKRRHCNGTSDIEIEKDIFMSSEIPSVTTPVTMTPGTAAGVTEDDDYPLYDSVASDEDLILAEQQTILAQQRATLEETTIISSSNVKPVSTCDLNAFKENMILSKLMEAENKIQDLQTSNQNLKHELTFLHQMIRFVLNENLDLRSGGFSNQAEVELGNRSNLLNGHNVDGRSPSPFLNARFKPSRPSSMCDPKTYRHEEFSGPGRNATSEGCLGKGRLLGVTNLVQESTRRIVELIKVLIEYAISSDHQGVRLTSNAIHEEVQEMATAIVSMKEAGSRKDINESLENVLFQVLRMKFELPAFCEKYNASSSSSNSSNPSPLVQKVKQRCFDVGAAMKQLMSVIIPQQNL